MKKAGLFLILALIFAIIGALEMGMAVKAVQIMKGGLFMEGGLHISAALLVGAIAIYNL